MRKHNPQLLAPAKTGIFIYEYRNNSEQALKLEPALRAYIAEILLERLDYEEDFVVSEA
jgi:hypothetical protein